MRPPRLRAVRLAAAALLCLAGGCATFAELPPRVTIPDGVPHGSLRVELIERAYRARPDRELARAPRPALADEVLAALAESGWFAPVGADVEDPDFLALVTLRRHQSFPSGVVLSALTAFLVPTSTDRHLSITMTLRNLTSEPGRCAVQGQFRTWYQLFLLPMSLSHGPGGHERRLVRRLTLACLDDLLEALARGEA